MSEKGADFTEVKRFHLEDDRVLDVVTNCYGSVGDVFFLSDGFNTPEGMKERYAFCGDEAEALYDALKLVLNK